MKKFVVSDFLVADADYFHYGNWDEVSKNLADNLASQEGFEDGGYVRMLQTYAVAETPKNKWMHWMKKFQRMAEDEISPEVRELPEDSLIEMDNEIYILDEYTRSHLEVLEGSLENWDEPGSVVQLIGYDDYGNVDMDEKIFDTGETYTQIFSDDYTVSENGAEVTMNTKQEEKYTVIATAAIPGNAPTQAGARTGNVHWKRLSPIAMFARKTVGRAFCPKSSPMGSRCSPGAMAFRPCWIVWSVMSKTASSITARALWATTMISPTWRS